MAINFNKFRNPELKAIMETTFDHAARLYNLGTPVVADPDRIVTIASMKNTTSYTLAAQPDVPRNITITHATVAAGTDTLGTITISGTNVFGWAISEVLTPVADSLVAGVTAFKTITSIIGTGWAIAGGNDTILVGVGTALGLPCNIAATTNVVIGIVGVALIAPTVVQNALVEKCTVDISSGTYDGSKKAMVFIVE